MNRRLLLSIIADSVALPGMARALPAPPPGPRRLHLSNPHTGETFDGPYRDDTGPIPSAMADLAVFLRDFHSGEIIGIDTGPLRKWDADDAGLGNLLFDGRQMHFNDKGELVVGAGRGRGMPLTGGQPTVRQRMARLHQLARAEFLA